MQRLNVRKQDCCRTRFTECIYAEEMWVLSWNPSYTQLKKKKKRGTSWRSISHHAGYGHKSANFRCDEERGEKVPSQRQEESKGKAGCATSFPPASLQPLRLTFAAFGAKAEVVDLTSVATLASHTRLALALSGSDVALAAGGAQRMAIAPGEGSHRSGRDTEERHGRSAPLKKP